LRFHQEHPPFQALSCRLHLLQRESEAVAAVISCLFLLGFRDNPAQGKSRDLRVNTGSSADQHNGTLLLNFVAVLTINVDLSGPSQICNSAFADKSACRIDIFDAPILPSSSGETGRLLNYRRKNAEEGCRRLGQTLALFPYLRATAIWLSIEAHFLECAISHA
jgi:hypothetical protein